MKKLLFVAVLALVAGAAVFAQVGPGMMGTRRMMNTAAQSADQTIAKTVTVEGKLALINGTIGIKSGTKTYYLPNLGRLAGFIDGVKEGSSVKVEGYEYPLAGAPEYSTVMVTKLTVGGKDYDLSQASCGNMMGSRGNMMGGRR